MILATLAVIAAVSRADLNADRVIDGADVAALISAWGSPAGDVTGDGQTDGADLAALLGAFGSSWRRNDAGDGAVYLMRNATSGPSPLGPGFTRWTETDPTQGHTFTCWASTLGVMIQVTHTVYPEQSIDERINP